MKREKLTIGGIPAVIWGEPSDKAVVFVHGKLSNKEAAEPFARIAERKGLQTLSFDLPEHGERAGNHEERCDILQGIGDLNKIADYAFSRWNTLSLFACSLGAYFSLNAYTERPFEKALFQSPIADMEELVKNMMLWFGVSEERLRDEREINTPVDTLRWDYYKYILSHPVNVWPIPTHILYGGKDNLQTREAVMRFAKRFSCRLTVSEDSEHAFMADGDAEIVAHWIQQNL